MALENLNRIENSQWHWKNSQPHWKNSQPHWKISMEHPIDRINILII